MSLPRYELYKSSGTNWLGDVPVHWEVRRLGYFFEERREKVSDKDFAPLSVTKHGVVPQLETAAKSDDGENRKKVLEGDFVINSRSDRKGSAGAASQDGSVSLISTVLRPMYTVEIRYIHHLLRSMAFQEEYYRYGKGIVADLWSTNYSEMRNIMLALPKLGEQLAIAAFLDRETAKIDALIAEQEKLIALLAEKREAIISHAVTKGLNPTASMRDSGVAWLGKVPAHWSAVPLKYLVELRSGGTPSKDRMDYWDGDIPWASAKDLKVERLGSTHGCITQKAIDDGAASLVQQGAVLVVVRGMILARIFPVVETLIPMAINQDLKAVVPLSRLDASFLAWLLRGSSSESLQRLDEAGHGTKALRMDAWTSMQLPVPPTDEQHQIAAFLSEATNKIDTLCTNAKNAISLLQERRSALITAAVTGQIDVRSAVPQPAAAASETIAA